MHKRTAIEALKAASSLQSAGAIPLVPALSRFFRDKGYHDRTVYQLADRREFGSAFAELIRRSDKEDPSQTAGLLDALAHVAIATRVGDMRLESYRGTMTQNRAIDRALWSLGEKDIIGPGAAQRMVVPRLHPSARMLTVPIAIIGYGAAGIMIAHALRRLGFRDVTIYDKRSALGIWSQSNVSRGSRNNPRHLRFNDYALDQAPGSGDAVVRFLNAVAGGFIPKKEAVVSVRPGDLRHEIDVRRRGKIVVEHYPIVINAMGLGKPKPLHDVTRMTCDTPRASAIRWQISGLTSEDASRQMHVFVGLGNSTAEMILQLQALQDSGVDTDYRILTHYPEEAVRHPSDTIVKGGRAYRVFRDLARTDLTAFQGDLEASRRAYFRALRDGKIIAGVSQWAASGQRISYTSRGSREISANRLFALIGYAHPADTYRAMGCMYDDEFACARHDYDGEVIRDTGGRGRDRLHPGYFSFGSVLETPHDPNAVVIPGMLFRLPDVLFGIIMRAAEASHAA